MPDITQGDVLNEKSFEVILDFNPSDKYDKTAISEILRLQVEIKKEISSLPKNEREVMELRYFQGLSSDKISEIVGKTREETIKIISSSVRKIKDKIHMQTSETSKEALELSVLNKVASQKINDKSLGEFARKVEDFPTQQMQKKVKKSKSFIASLVGLTFNLAFLLGCYFVVQKFFFHNLPPLKTLATTSTNIAKKYIPFISSKGKTLSDAEKRKALSSAPNQINVSGSTSLFKLSRRWENSFSVEYPGYRVDLVNSDSNAGINALIEGRTDIANSSRPLNFYDRQKASEYGIELAEYRVALDALAIIANKKNPVSEVSLDDLQKIFLSEVTNWKEIRSAKLENPFYSPINALVRQEGSGINDLVVNRVLQGNRFPSSILKEESNKEIFNFVSMSEGTISYTNSTNYPWDNGNIKFIKIKNYDDSISVSPFEGQMLNENAIRYGDYPLAHYLYVITLQNPPDKVKNYLSWILSREGQRVVSYSGLIPVVRE